MPQIRVVTDSACDIPDTLLRQFDIAVVPHTIRLGEERFHDRTGITTSQLLKRIGAGPNPVVEAPPVEAFSRLYRSMRETCDGVISIHTSAKISEAFDNASVAREAFGPVGHGGPFPVAVVDSESVSMGLGWVVLAVAHAAKAGLELPKLATLTTRLRGQSHVAFITDNSEPLLRAGLLAHLQRENIGSLKPLFHVDEGQLQIYERTRTRAKARDGLYNFVEDFPRIGEIAVFHTGAQNDLEHLMTRIGAIYSRERVAIIQPNASVATWLGPEALGVAVFEGDE